MNKDILICGVGGQGTVLASKILASAAMSAGYTVHSAETIGMAQRGGSVTSHIRIGDGAYSPLIPKGGADMIIAFEPSEAVKNLSYLKRDGFAVVSRTPVKPITDADYDGKECTEYITRKTECLILDAEELCGGFGPKFLNCAILGAAAGTGKLGLEPELIVSEMEKRIARRFVETNKKAFAAGLSAAQTQKGYE